MENEENWLGDISKGSFHTDYILGEIIGRGSASTVHSCLYKGKKEYACKIIPKAKLNRAEVRTRIETLLKLRHHNIVSVREVYEESHHLNLIQDLATGGELLERLASRGAYSEKDAAKAVRDALAALNYIHDLGLWHGSIRPEKLIYATEDENSKLLLTGRGITPFPLNGYNALYCAPEVLNGRTASPAADMWSLGVVIYIMLCGFEPFRTTETIAFPAPYWDDKSSGAKKLIAQHYGKYGCCSKLMQQSAENRPTVRDLLENSWVCGEKTAGHSMIHTAKHLREFNARRKFKVATLVVRATHRAMTLAHYHGDRLIHSIN